MSEEIIREWNFWIASIAAGACMAFLYDLIRLFRRLIRHGRIAVDLEDILYWAACFFLSFILLYYGNDGVIRFAAVLGAAAGMALYAVTLGRFFVKAGYWIIDKTVGSLLRLLVKIIKKICCIFNPIKRGIAKVYNKWIKQGLFQKYRLTRLSFRNKMEIHHQKKTKMRKGKADYGRPGSEHKKAKTRKNTKVSAKQK